LPGNPNPPKNRDMGGLKSILKGYRGRIQQGENMATGMYPRNSHALADGFWEEGSWLGGSEERTKIFHGGLPGERSEFNLTTCKEIF